jgi:hypothetical protein
MNRGKSFSVALFPLVAFAAVACATDEQVLRSSAPEKNGGAGGARSLLDASSTPPGVAGTAASNEAGAPRNAEAIPYTPLPDSGCTGAGCGVCASGQTQYLPSYAGPNGISVAIHSTPANPQLGDHQTWDMVIRAANGQVIPASTQVTVECLMNHEGFSHGCPANISVTRTGDAYVAEPVIFNMQGAWVMTVHVGELDTVSFDVCAS